jgi:hypothetical protein
MSNVLALFEKFPQDKTGVKMFQRSLKMALLSGDHNILEPFTKIRMLQDALTILKDEEIEEEVMLQLNRYPEKTVDIYGCAITKKSNPGSWDYSKCDDQALKDMEIKLSALSEAIKERKAFLQNVPTEGVSDLNGDIIQRAFKTPGKDSFSLKIL